MTPAFDPRFPKEQVVLERHPSRGSGGEPGGWNMDLDEEEEVDWQRCVHPSALVQDLAAAPRALATEDSAAPQAGAPNSPAVLYAEIIPLQQVGLRG